MFKALNVAICQINPTLGSFENNLYKITNNYEQAIKKGADLVVFPEMSITGYPPQALLSNNNFVDHKPNMLCLVLLDLIKNKSLSLKLILLIKS